jgi:hypothetical protein
MAMTRHRPAGVLTTIAVLFFLGITAFAGGLALLLGFTPPAQWLDGVPVITSWVVPALVLGIGFGIGSLVTGYGVLRRPHWPVLDFVQRWTRHHWAWAATILIGLGHVVWIGLELIYLPDPSALQLIYGPIGVALTGLPFLPSVREYLGTPR